MIHEVPNSKVQLGSTLWCPLCKQTCWLICLISWCRWWLFLGSTTFCQRWAEGAENRNGEFLINQPSFVSCFCFSCIMISLFNLSLFILRIVPAASELVSIWYFMCGLRVMYERSIFAVYCSDAGFSSAISNWIHQIDKTSICPNQISEFSPKGFVFIFYF